MFKYPQLIVLSLLVASCSPKVVTQISKQEQTPTVDASPDEYLPFRYYSTETGVTYALSNDNKNLYFCFKIEDPAVQQKIMRGGLEVYFDTTKKATQLTGIIYPLPAASYENQREAQLDGDKLPTKDRPDIQHLHQRFLANQRLVNFRGFKGVNGVMSVDNKTGIKLSINWDSTNAMIYEGKVPLKLFFHEDPKGLDASKVFHLTVNMKNVNTAQGGSGKSPVRTSISVGGGVGMGMGMGGGISIGGGGMGSRGSMTERNGFTVPFRLATE